MKKIFSTVFVFAAFVSGTFAQGGQGAACTIDQSNTTFFVPSPGNVPCAKQNTPYDEVLQFHIPASIDLADYGVPISYILNVDSIVLDSITGLPSGLSWQANAPGPVYYGGENGCGRTFGTTTANTGNYPLVFHGTCWVSGNPFPGFFDGDTSFTLQQLIGATSNGTTFSLDLVAQGASCTPSGISNYSKALNAEVSVYPNPSNGTFELKLNTATRANGEVVVMDMTGKTVHSQSIDALGVYTTTMNLTGLATGIYTLQIRTTEGVASKSISIE